MSKSPYKNQNKSNWLSITDRLIKDYPLTRSEILEISLLSWGKIMDYQSWKHY